MVAIVIPAHNEEHVIGELLSSLLAGGLSAEVVVVANGCSDGTAASARRVPGVTVLETPVASKTRALALGDARARSFPRLYVDGDVVLGADDVRALCAALETPGIHAAGPSRVLPMHGVSRVVRGYYRVWQRLPGVAGELYGRGVIAVDREGWQRLAGWHDTMSDDLRAAMSFAPHEVAIVPSAEVLIHPPRTYADLLRRRVRVRHGNRALATATSSLPRHLRPSGASPRWLAQLLRREPALAPAIAAFLLTAALTSVPGRLAALRGSSAWLRDESSRTSRPTTPLPPQQVALPSTRKDSPR